MPICTLLQAISASDSAASLSSFRITAAWVEPDGVRTTTGRLRVGWFRGRLLFAVFLGHLVGLDAEKGVAYETDNSSGNAFGPRHVLGHRNQLHRGCPAGLSPRFATRFSLKDTLARTPFPLSCSAQAENPVRRTTANSARALGKGQQCDRDGRMRPAAHVPQSHFGVFS